MEVGKLNPPDGGIFLYNIAQRSTGLDAGKPGGWKAKLFAGLSAL
jgi:hypothetical protein